MIRDEFRNRKLDEAFQHHGQTAQMTMKNFSEEEVAQGKTPETRRVIGTLYRADISFQTKDGKLVTMPSHLLPKEFAARYKQAGVPGKLIDIIYLPESETTIRLANYRRVPGSLFGVSLLGIGGLLLCLLMLRARAK